MYEFVYWINYCTTMIKLLTIQVGMHHASIQQNICVVIVVLIKNTTCTKKKYYV